LLQQLDRDVIRRTHEGHAAIAWRTVDGHTALHEPFAQRVDVIDRVGEVPEVAGFTVILQIPVPGEFDDCRLVAGRREEYERVAAIAVFVAAQFAQGPSWSQ
jgi:hypothetical protein